jgi:Flp pilus assembly protein TadG
MLRRPKRTCRRGVAALEAAIVYSVVLFLTLAVIIVGLGVFRYSQLAYLAREGARWASVRGSQYATELGKKAATTQDIQNYIMGKAAGLNASALQIQVSWNQNNAQTYTNSNGQPIQNTISVTVTYQWVPEAYFSGVTLSSTSVVPMSY